MKRHSIFLFLILCTGLSQAAHLQNTYLVILAGGKGERLWPLSREQKPKQLLSFNQGPSLLELALERIEELVPKENIWLVVHAKQKKATQSLVGERVGKILAEPSNQDTGPAILLACMMIKMKNPQATVAFLPADHIIEPKEAFRESLAAMCHYASSEQKIALLGLKPTFPATGYGYIEYARTKKPGSFEGPFPVIKFHEKPSRDLAIFYATSDQMLWNIGVFCAQNDLFLKEFSTHAPEMIKSMKAYFDDKAKYSEIPKISIDYAIMEKSKNTVVLPVHFSWSDIGNLDTFLSLQNALQINDKIVQINARDNIVHAPGKLVSLIGVDDLCIVHDGDVLVISKRSEVEKIKLVTSELRQRQLQSYL